MSCPVGAGVADVVSSLTPSRPRIATEWHVCCSIRRLERVASVHAAASDFMRCACGIVALALLARGACGDYTGGAISGLGLAARSEARLPAKRRRAYVRGGPACALCCAALVAGRALPKFAPSSPAKTRHRAQVYRHRDVVTRLSCSRVTRDHFCGLRARFDAKRRGRSARELCVTCCAQKATPQPRLRSPPYAIQLRVSVEK